MQVHYRVEVRDPKNHLVTVSMQLPKRGEQMQVFLPSWSPGSYLMREYPRHIRTFGAQQKNGEELFHHQVAKGTFLIDFARSVLNNPQGEFSVQYEVYCHELTVRTSHIDESHAFLHGPSYLMGVLGEQLSGPTIEFRFPALWSKLATGLQDISPDRGKFLYRAENYEQLLDSPVEIGCHESDGFMLEGRPHHLNIYGQQYPHRHDLKGDVQKIVETISQIWGEIPYQQYVFIAHLAPGLYGGLEHHNSTALHFDGTQLHRRKNYLAWLELVAHEYFHTWNAKRIHPKGFVPFDYRRENYTRMHWLTEGLTSFMDRLSVLRSGLMTLEEYLEKLLEELNRLAATPGRKFHSLEESSFNAWIKLYRPDENTRNSSVSYYLKGGLVFLALQCMFARRGKDVSDLLHLLWAHYKQHPQEGVLAEEVYGMVESLAGGKARERFEEYITTTQEIDFITHLADVGLQVEWKEEKEAKAYFGIEPELVGDRVSIKRVELDGPAYKAGLNAGDELLFFNGVRLLKKQWEDLPWNARIGHPHQVVFSRLGRMQEGQVIAQEPPRQIKRMTVADPAKAHRCFGLGK